MKSVCVFKNYECSNKGISKLFTIKNKCLFPCFGHLNYLFLRKSHISQTYVNEEFGTGLSGIVNDRNNLHSESATGRNESEYSTLNINSREDNTTYEKLRH